MVTLESSVQQVEGRGPSFAFTPEQRAIEELARDFARREIDPIVEEIDEAQRFPREVMAKAGELGFLGMLFPEELGGAGLGYIEYVLVITELSKVDPSVGISVGSNRKRGSQPPSAVMKMNSGLFCLD